MLKLPWPFAPPTKGYLRHQLSSVISLTLVLQQSLRLSGLKGQGSLSMGWSGGGGRR